MTIRKFILVVGEDVVTEMTMPDVNKFSGHIQALLNNPRFVEIPIDSEIDKGWTWDGLNFYPPLEG
jgi:hypothetical protein